MYKDVIMLLEGALAEIMVKLSLKIYSKYLTMISKGKSLLYVQIQKSIYGLLQSSLLLYRKLVKYLGAYELHINPYDPLLANNVNNKKQMAVVWHIDNLKVSHMHSFEITNFAGYLYIIYGGLEEHRVKVHD